MKIIKTLWLIPVLGLLPIMPSFAHGYSHQHYFERRIENQRMQINLGVRRGDLTRYETKKLYKEHWRIIRFNRVYLSDGRLNRRERHSLDNMLDRAAKHIYRLRHNNRYSYRAGGRGYRFAYRGRY